MVFRRENKADAFQRQISALRQQLGPEGEEAEEAARSPREDAGQEAESGVSFRGDRRRESDSYASDRSPFEPSGYGTSTGADDFPAAPEPGEGSLELAPPVPAIPTVDAQASVIAHDAVWSGDLRSDGSIHVHGRVEGSITSRQDVFVAEEATVDATIAAVNIIVAGQVKGSIRCQGRFEALPQGRIAADVQAPALVVHEGASITGGFRMGSEPAAEGTPAPPSQPPAPVVHRRAARGGA